MNIMRQYLRGIVVGLIVSGAVLPVLGCYVKNHTQQQQPSLPSPVASSKTCTCHGNWITINGDITEQCASDFVEFMQQISDNQENDTVVICLDSGGGSVYAGFRILSCMHASRLHTVTYDQSMACSMAAVILSAGDHRIMSPMSIFMIHSISSSHEGRIEELRNEMEAMERTNYLLFNELARNCHSDVEKITNLCHSQGGYAFYGIPSEALSIGLIDDIGYIRSK